MTWVQYNARRVKGLFRTRCKEKTHMLLLDCFPVGYDKVNKNGYCLDSPDVLSFLLSVYHDVFIPFLTIIYWLSIVILPLSPAGVY